MLSLMGRVNGNDNNSVGGEISLQGPTKILQIWHVYFFFANSAEIKKNKFFFKTIFFMFITKSGFFFSRHISPNLTV